MSQVHPPLRPVGTITGGSPLERTPRRFSQVSEGPNPDVSAGLPGVAAQGEQRLRSGS